MRDAGIDLCFDTGHYAVWGQDTVAYMEKVFPRIAYMHLKNVDAGVQARMLARELPIAQSYGAGLMCPLPDGVVDIGAVMQLLGRRGFNGPVVVEQDIAENAAETPLHLAARNLAYIQQMERAAH